MRIALLSLFTLIFSLSTVSAKPQTTTTEILADNWLLSHLFAYVRLHSGMTIDKANQLMKIKFQRMDIDGGGISSKDYLLHRQIQQARLRAITIKKWARHDLDGDGFVTRKEFSILLSKKVPRTLNFGGESVETTAKQRAALIKKSVDKKMRADLDTTGSVSMQEAVAAGENTRRPLRYLRKSARPPEIPTTLDHNNDGSISFEEFSTVAKRVLKRIDVDGNGELSQEEVRNYWQLRRRAKKNMPL